MNEEIEVLKSIYSRTNEIVYDDLSQTITYNAYDDNLHSIGFSTTIYANNTIIIDSQILTRDELKQLRNSTSLKSTLYELFTTLKCFYDELILKRTIDTIQLKTMSSIYFMKIDHMRSPNIYMKHLRQWSNELNITGRILIVPHCILILIEGDPNDLKVVKFIVKLKTENVDIDSRGKPCKERLLTQLVQFNDYLPKFNNFDKIDLKTRDELEKYLTQFQYEHLLDSIRNV